MKEISYLKSFKIQDDDDEEVQELITDDEDEHSGQEPLEGQEQPASKRMKLRRNKKKKNYFHFIRYAIANASIKSSHVSMQPCYGYDITPSSGHLLDRYNSGFIQTSLPQIRPPLNDFHANL